MKKILLEFLDRIEICIENLNWSRWNMMVNKNIKFDGIEVKKIVFFFFYFSFVEFYFNSGMILIIWNSFL